MVKCAGSNYYACSSHAILFRPQAGPTLVQHMHVGAQVALRCQILIGPLQEGLNRRIDDLRR